jgi:hypothetical protein
LLWQARESERQPESAQAWPAIRLLELEPAAIAAQLLSVAVGLAQTQKSLVTPSETF